MTKLINLTPHAINIVKLLDNGEFIKIFDIPVSGQLARCKASTVQVGGVWINCNNPTVESYCGYFDYYSVEDFNVPITSTEYGEVEGLPDPQPDTMYIVSSLVAQRVKERDDVLVPGETVRDSEGRIVGCKSLARVR